MVALLCRDALLLEQFAHVVVVQVDGRHHDVTGLLAFQLDDALAEVGLDHLDTLRLQEGVHLALLRQHRLRLHHLLDMVLLQDVIHDVVELLGVLRPMHDTTVFLGIGGKLVQIVALDGTGLLAQLLPFLQTVCHIVTFRPY